jgi:hypothetical protein
MAWGAAALVAAIGIVAGCEETQQTAATPATSIAPPVVENASQPAATATPPVSPPVVPPVVPPVTPPSSTGNSETANPPATAERTVAEVGVGAKGRYSSNDYVSTVVGAYFGIQQRLAFDQAQRGLNDFKTLNGDYPKTHEQYWKEVIEANLITLPELPDGEEYYYDYEAAKRTSGEEALFVVRPK